MRSSWFHVFVWLAAAAVAFALATAHPNDTRVMGHFPYFSAQTLDRQPISVPDGLLAERTLALITFKGSQRGAVESWIKGLNLSSNTSVAWVRMPVLNDPGNFAAREAIHSKLLQRYTQDSERARLAPIFTDRESFIRAAGLSSPEQVYAVVISRDGEVLARVEGEFDPVKAEALRETLFGPAH